MKRKTTKSTYRLRNWKEYNSALVKRGSLTIWIDEDSIKAWQHPPLSVKRGRPRTYPDTAILAMASVAEVYNLPLRATQGLLSSVIKLMKLTLPVPDYTTLSRRRKELKVELPRRPTAEAVHLVVDSTGVKVYGEGEWKVRQHGYSRRRTWRKLHLAADEATGEIVAAVVTTNSFKDSQVLPDLLEQIEDAIAQVTADGAYDSRNCYLLISERSARAAIPPQKRARVWQHGNSLRERLPRDEKVRRIRQIGRAAWKRESKYHRRSLAETQMFRLKTIFGEHVRARSFEGQAAQMLTRCAVLNRMTHLGMPDSYAV